MVYKSTSRMTELQKHILMLMNQIAQLIDIYYNYLLQLDIRIYCFLPVQQLPFKLP